MPRIRNPQWPEALDALLARAMDLHRLGQWAQAGYLYRTILERVPGHADSLHLLGLILHAEGRHSEAAALLAEAIESNSGEALYHAHLALVLRALDQPHQAVAACRRALTLRPDCAEALTTLGNIRLAQDRAAEALTAYRRALAGEPAEAGMWFNLAVAALRLGQQDRAEAACRALLALDPASARGYHTLAKALLERRDRGGAGRCAARAVALAPDSPEHHTGLGAVLLALGRAGEAEANLRWAVALAPERTDIRANLGFVLGRNGKVDEAIACHRRSLAIEPDHAETLAELAFVLISLGRHGDAVACLAAAGSGHGPDQGLCRLVCRAYTMVARWLDGEVLPDDLGRTCDLDHRLTGSLASSCRIYAELLAALAPTRKAKPDRRTDDDILHIIGESHCLAGGDAPIRLNGRTWRGRSHLVMGVKMWHLAQSSADSFFRLCVQRHLAALPAGSAVLFTIGEIDCRPDEGMWPHHRRSKMPLATVLEATISGYAAKLETLLPSRGAPSLTLQGIPAPGYALDGANDPGDRQGFLDMIRDANRLLRQQALQRGWGFLDVYAATADRHGLGNGRWHLDRVHLHPRFYTEASA
ncbi:putative Tetratricopeptide repeat containing protein [Candidatus Terasakiella magnetica]|nr:putative Tetratricopeptide repeat containing protein [Candidatus Terasakiella magnetica]